MSDLPPPTAPTYDSGYAHAATDLAGFWRRFGAYFIDAILVGAVVGVIQAIIGAIAGVDQTVTTLRGGLFGLILEVAYFGYFWSRSGQTIGYMAFGLRLVRADGTPVTLGLALVRGLLVYLSFAICAIPALISAFMVGLGSRKQGIHDLMVGTLVVRA